MRLRFLFVAIATVLTIGGSLAVASAATDTTAVDPAVLEGLCIENTPDEAELADCLTVVHLYLVPGSGPGIGTRIEDGGLAVTIVDAAWDATVPGVTTGEGEQLVAIRVAYEAIEAGDYSASDDWTASDQVGDRLVQVTPGLSPALGAGSLARGDTTEGWVTFRVPAELPMLAVTYTDGFLGDEHGFLIRSGATAANLGGEIAIVPAATSMPTATAKPQQMSFATLSDRGWKRLVKNPEATKGRGYVLYACVWQFDGATGPTQFLASASYRKETYWYSDGENVSVSGEVGRLDDVVEGDIVWMRVISLGSYSYDTQAGGNTTVPAFEVVQIKRQKGSC